MVKENFCRNQSDRFFILFFVFIILLLIYHLYLIRKSLIEKYIFIQINLLN